MIPWWGPVGKGEGDCPVHCGMFSSIFSLYLLDACSKSLLWQPRKHVQTFSNIPWRGKLASGWEPLAWTIKCTPKREEVASLELWTACKRDRSLNMRGFLGKEEKEEGNVLILEFINWSEGVGKQSKPKLQCLEIRTVIRVPPRVHCEHKGSFLNQIRSSKKSFLKEVLLTLNLWRMNKRQHSEGEGKRHFSRVRGRSWVKRFDQWLVTARWYKKRTLHQNLTPVFLSLTCMPKNSPSKDLTERRCTLDTGFSFNLFVISGCQMYLHISKCISNAYLCNFVCFQPMSLPEVISSMSLSSRWKAVYESG